MGSLSSTSHSSLNIVIVEDHADLRNLFIELLQDQSHQAVGFHGSEDLDDYLANRACDLLILDLNLPGEDGFSIATRLRAAHPELFIIMLTARTTIDDRVRGYASGADLYLVKPVSDRELCAAVQSVARRIQTARERAEIASLDLSKLTFTRRDVTFDLSKPDCVLLKALAEAPARKLDYWRLLELLEMETDEKGKTALEVRVWRLKRKLAEHGFSRDVIKVVRKEGYQLCLSLRVVD